MIQTAFLLLLYLLDVNGDSISQCAAASECSCEFKNTDILVSQLLEYNKSPANLLIIKDILEASENSYDLQMPNNVSFLITCANKQLSTVPNFKRLGYSTQPTINCLDMRNNRINRITEGIFYGLLIQCIDLSFNRVDNTNLNSMNGLKNILRILKMNHNQMTHRTVFTSLFLSQMTHLEALFLASNQFKHIWDNSFSPVLKANLRILDLSNNSIVFISRHAFYGFPSLSFLNLCNNLLATENITASNQPHKLDFLNDLTSLESINLCSNGIHQIQDLTNISRNLALKQMDLSQNRIRSLTWTFCKNLESSHLGKLQVLDLSQNQIVKINFLDLSCLHNLSELYLQSNRIYFIQIRSFEGLDNLRTLHINNNPLVPYSYMFNGLGNSLIHLRINLNSYKCNIKRIRFNSILRDIILDGKLSNLKQLDLSSSSFTQMTIDVGELLAKTKLESIVCNSCSIQSLFFEFKEGRDNDDNFNVCGLHTVSFDLGSNLINDCWDMGFSKREKYFNGSGSDRHANFVQLLSEKVRIENFYCRSSNIRGYQNISWYTYYLRNVLNKNSNVFNRTSQVCTKEAELEELLMMEVNFSTRYKFNVFLICTLFILGFTLFILEIYFYI